MPGHEVYALGLDLGRAAAKVGPAAFTAYKIEAEAFAADWRASATATSGRHGKWYPSSITVSMRIGMTIEAEIGPETGRRQGHMGRGFEFGSRNQPAHLDGARNMPKAEARLRKSAGAAVGRVLP